MKKLLLSVLLVMPFISCASQTDVHGVQALGFYRIEDGPVDWQSQSVFSSGDLFFMDEWEVTVEELATSHLKDPVMFSSGVIESLSGSLLILATAFRSNVITRVIQDEGSGTIVAYKQQGQPGPYSTFSLMPADELSVATGKAAIDYVRAWKRHNIKPQLKEGQLN